MPVMPAGDEMAEWDVLALARSYFDMREFARCAHLLSGARSARGVFLRCYALFLVRRIPRSLLMGSP